MNKRTWIIVLSLVVVFFGTCIVGAVFFLGFFLDQGPLSSESRAQLLIRLQGGTHILLEIDASPSSTIDPKDLETEEAILSNRLHALADTAIVKIKDDRHLTIDLPGNTNPSQIVDALHMGLLEFVDVGNTPLEAGQVIDTTAYRTIMTGKDLRVASIAYQQTTNLPYIEFTLTDAGKKVFADFTSKNINKYLAIVIDKKVIMAPIIKSPITEGRGIIEGKFTIDEIKVLVIQLRYGALPFPLKIVETTTVSQ